MFLHDACALALAQLEMLGRAFNSERAGFILDPVRIAVKACAGGAQGSPNSTTKLRSPTPSVSLVDN